MMEDILTEALISEKGIRIPCDSVYAAKRWRWRAYYVIKRANIAARAAGLERSEFSDLTFSLDGTTVLVKPPQAVRVEPL